MVYPQMLKEYLEYCKYRDNYFKNGKLNLANLRWFYPSLTLLLREFIVSMNVSNFVYPSKGNITDYFKFICNPSSISTSGSSMPVIEAKRMDDSYMEHIYKIAFSGKFEERTAVQNDIKYIFGEVVANIDEHSKCSKSFFTAQHYMNKGFFEAAFLDNGITIPGTFKQKGILKDLKDVEYIKKATEGISTKEGGGRGHGLPSICKIIKDMNGDILIVSGNGALYINGTDKYLKEDMVYSLSDSLKLGGTLVSLRLHMPINPVDFYKDDYL
jgi:hypothetical protein